MKTYKIMDGNNACALGAYYFSEICGIYPITPSSPMATLCDKWSSEGKKNVLNTTVKVVEMQSEAGASGFVHGSLQGGTLTSTFTSSQGLLLMIPSMYKIAGEMLPCVIHVAARSLSTHALSIFGDHQDIYATRATGFCFLASSNVQEAYYMSLISHLSSLKGSLPFLHFFDGFRTSHELNKIEILDEETIKNLAEMKYINDFKERSINLDKNITRGTSQTEDIYFQITESRNKFYEKMPDIVSYYMKKINAIAKTNYKPFNYYGSKYATNIIIAMGSVTDTIKLVVDKLNKEGNNVGVVTVHLYRPFSSKYLLNIIPDSVSKVTVLDRTKEAGSIGEPLYLDVVTTLKDKNVLVLGGRYGLSSKDTTPSDILSVYNNMALYSPKNNFTIGIKDDLTNLSLDKSDIEIINKTKEIKCYGFGSDGMVTGAKTLIKVIGKKDKFVQGYFEYDSKKSGGVTISHLRISENSINMPFYIKNPSLIAITKEEYINLYNPLENIKGNGILLLASNKNDLEINEFINNDSKIILKSRNIKIFIVEKSKVLNDYNLGNKINTVMINYILKLLGSTKNDIDYYKELLKKAFVSKSEIVVNNNLDAIDNSIKYIRELDTNILTNSKQQTCDSCKSTECIFKRNGNDLSVKDLISHKDGTFIGGTSTSCTSKISDTVPVWDKTKCIQCNKCSFVCPHAVIRPFLIKDEDLSKYGLVKDDCLPAVGEENMNFYVAISGNNCTGCTHCTDVCPAIKNEKSLVMGENLEKNNKIATLLFENHKNISNFNKYTVKGLGFKETGFMFPGACAGCGETPYIRILSQLYKDEIVIANATGCSSIYGGSLPSLPYNIPWVNSLFEDNAEFGLGIHQSYKKIREEIKEIMYNTRNDVTTELKDIYKLWIDNMENYETTRKVYKYLKEFETNEELLNKIEYVKSRIVYIIGGDGWAYDIGYGGLDHVLRQNENVKVLILDTEVYSNTGGQSSKSTKTSAVAEFAQTGKITEKKDLFKNLMNIPNIYVASISLGADFNGVLKAFKESYEHDGPSVIIAYSPCIEHEIKGGLKNSIKDTKLLVETGYNLLMRYNGNTDKLIIDSKEPDFSRYETIFLKEQRYNNLKKFNKEKYNKLYEQNLDNAKKRYKYYSEKQDINN